MSPGHLSALSPSPPPWLRAITKGAHVYALLVRAEYHGKGMEFVTPKSLTLQAGLACHPKGYIIPAHTHKRVPRSNDYTLEVLVMRRGSLHTYIYDEQGAPLEDFILQAGDMLVLIDGGHGFEALTDIEMYEVKQGPYLDHAADKELL